MRTTKRTFVQWAWLGWECLYRILWGVRPIQPRQPHLFFVAKHRYLGRPFEVDGVRVGWFDPVVELHMNNEVLLEALRTQRSIVGLAVKLLQEAKRSLPALAACLSQEPYRGIQVVYGITFIHRGVDRFGFQALPLRRPLLARFVQWYLQQIFRIVNPDADRLIRAHPDAFVPKLVAIRMDRLLRAYGAVCEPQAAQAGGGNLDPAGAAGP
ncbi:MAG: hypothetical protein IRZ33_06255, partial [Alicyclobacillaceae bacterium]|nr:hypothetical protein [Alicyclobacillaceae bacterium]